MAWTQAQRHDLTGRKVQKAAFLFILVHPLSYLIDRLSTHVLVAESVALCPSFYTHPTARKAPKS